MTKLDLKNMLFSALILNGIPVSGAAQTLPGALPTVQSTVERQATQAAERASEQAVERAATQAAERAATLAQEQAAALVIEQTADRIQNQADAVRDQAVDRIQNQAERVQGQAVDRAQSQVNRAQNQVERTQNQAAGRTQSQLERLQDLPARAGPAVDRGLSPRTEGSPMRPLPPRLPIADRQGNEAFVEITIEPNIRVLEREWVMLISEAQREQLNNEAPELMRFLTQTRPFTALDSYLLKFNVPPDLDADDQILQLVPESLRELMDRNHIYSAQSEAISPPTAAFSGLAMPMRALCENPVSVGMIDSAIDPSHPAFNHGVTVFNKRFIDADLAEPHGHGTAVAGVMLGKGPNLNPLLPHGTIYNASVVYEQDNYHQGASAMQLLEALDWLLGLDIQVINMSLTGPDNRILERGINAALAQNKVIVAAAGNAGPHAPDFYPAAYPGVLSATAVTGNKDIYRWANQGKHIDFAALGVAVPTARGNGGFGFESGTSLAASVISAFMACELIAHDKDVDAAIYSLQNKALDLGATGHDPVFGHGLLHPN